MELGLGEIFVIVLLAVLLLEPQDLPKLAQKAGQLLRQWRSFTGKKWLDPEEQPKEK